MKHPYENIGDYARWDKAVSTLPPESVDPVVSFPFRLTREQPIVTAGSCFAQHIGRYLKQSGFNYLVTEPGHPILEDGTKERFNYGLFSARYGNLYTARQLEQLFRRAYGDFLPEESSWPGREGLVDPFRPTIQPAGFRTARELEADRGAAPRRRSACLRGARRVHLHVRAHRVLDGRK
jgi:GSCFA family